MDGRKRGFSFTSFVIGVLLGIVTPNLPYWVFIERIIGNQIINLKTFMDPDNLCAMLYTSIDRQGRKYYMDYINCFSKEDYYQYYKFENKEAEPFEEISCQLEININSRLYHINLINAYSLEDQNQYLYNNLNDDVNESPAEQFYKNTHRTIFHINLINKYSLEDQYQYPFNQFNDEVDPPDAEFENLNKILQNHLKNINNFSLEDQYQYPEHYIDYENENISSNMKNVINIQRIHAHSLEDHYQYECDYFKEETIEETEIAPLLDLLHHIQKYNENNSKVIVEEQKNTTAQVIILNEELKESEEPPSLANEIIQSKVLNTNKLAQYLDSQYQYKCDYMKNETTVIDPTSSSNTEQHTKMQIGQQNTRVGHSRHTRKNKKRSKAQLIKQQKFENSKKSEEENNLVTMILLMSY